jgi:MFS family permease
MSMAALSAPREKMALAIGTVQTAQRMGPALGPVIGGLLAPVVGLRNTFLVAAVFYAVALVVLTVLYREPPRAERAEDDRQRTPFTTILNFENFLLLMLVIFGLQLVDRSFGPVLPLYLGQLGYGPEDVLLVSGVLFSVLAFAGALGNQLAAGLLARVSARTLIASAVLVGAAALAIFTWTASTWLLVASMSAIGLCIGAAMTTAFAAAGAVIPRNVHATGFGLLTTASLAGLAVSPVLSGLVAGRSIRVVFAAGIVALIVLAIVVRRVMVEPSRPVQPAPVIEES